MVRCYLSVFGRQAGWLVSHSIFDYDNIRDYISIHYNPIHFYWLEDVDDEGVTTGYEFGKARYRLLKIQPVLQEPKTKVDEIICAIKQRQDLWVAVKNKKITVRKVAELLGESVATTGRAIKKIREGG